MFFALFLLLLYFHHACWQIMRDSARTLFQNNENCLATMQKRKDLYQGNITVQTIRELNKKTRRGTAVGGEFRVYDVSFGDCWGVPWQEVPKHVRTCQNTQ